MILGSVLYFVICLIVGGDKRRFSKTKIVVIRREKKEKKIRLDCSSACVTIVAIAPRTCCSIVSKFKEQCQKKVNLRLIYYIGLQLTIYHDPPSPINDSLLICSEAHDIYRWRSI